MLKRKRIFQGRGINHHHTLLIPHGLILIIIKITWLPLLVVGKAQGTLFVVDLKKRAVEKYNVDITL